MDKKVSLLSPSKSQNTITIPKEFIYRLGWEPKDKLNIKLEGKKLIITKEVQ